MTDIDCDGDIVVLLRSEDGPFKIEVLGCAVCELGVFVFITEDGHESSVTVDRDQTPEAAARQGMARYLMQESW